MHRQRSALAGLRAAATDGRSSARPTRSHTAASSVQGRLPWKSTVSHSSRTTLGAERVDAHQQLLQQLPVGQGITAGSARHPLVGHDRHQRGLLEAPRLWIQAALRGGSIGCRYRRVSTAVMRTRSAGVVEGVGGAVAQSDQLVDAPVAVGSSASISARRVASRFAARTAALSSASGRPTPPPAAPAHRSDRARSALGNRVHHSGSDPQLGCAPGDQLVRRTQRPWPCSGRWWAAHRISRTQAAQHRCVAGAGDGKSRRGGSGSGRATARNHHVDVAAFGTSPDQASPMRPSMSSNRELIAAG